MVSIILKSLLAVLTKMLVATASKDVIEWMLFHVIELIVKSTKTPHDDAFYAKVKEAYANADITGEQETS
ncbi:hypothetical protein [Photobacterium halotolerans]|uniref:hypothetical protein n=1 Tax=Photobacterium halotolerans TaxID=265726 RepID=UPI0004165741|nr:hypothetical protein [Photobacterium halotolerans]